MSPFTQKIVSSLKIVFIVLFFFGLIGLNQIYPQSVKELNFSFTGNIEIGMIRRVSVAFLFLLVGLITISPLEKNKMTTKIFCLFSCFFVFFISFGSNYRLHKGYRFWEVYHFPWSLQQKKQWIYGFAYEYAQGCRQVYPQRGNAQLITDMDLEGGEERTLRNALAYCLYPIDIRNVHPGEKDCLVIFHKKRAIEFVPADYVILKKFNEENLFAVKKERIKK